MKNQSKLLTFLTVCIWDKGKRDAMTEIYITTVNSCFTLSFLQYHWKLFKEYNENNIPEGNYSRKCCSRLTTPPVM